jgi:hypothetical protein
MKNLRLLPLLAAAALGSGACAAREPYTPTPQVGTGAEAFAPAHAPRARPRSELLTEQELDDARNRGVGTAHALIAERRPQWLYNRGGSVADSDGSVAVQVYYNGRRLGGVESLASINLSSVISMRRIDPIEARATWGPGNGRGVILVTGR